jgi:hypothetical protein
MRAMRRGRTVAALLIFLALPGTAQAGPWTPSPGDGYAKLWLKWFYGIGYHDAAGHTTDYGRYNELFLATYGEIGAADGFAVFWHTDLVRIFTLDDPVSGRETHATPGDPAIGVRWRFLQADRYVMAFEAAVRAPLADDDRVQEVHSAEGDGQRIGFLRIGAGVWDFATSLHAGYAFDRVYVAGSVGHILRGDGYDDVFTWTAEVGARFGERWSGRLRLTGHHALDENRAPYDESPSGIGNGTSYTGAAVEVECEVVPDGWVGFAIEGSARIIEIERQSGGPVVSVYGATRF